MNNRLVVSLIAASLVIPGAAFAQSTTVEGARVGGEVAGPVGATVGAAVGLGDRLADPLLDPVPDEAPAHIAAGPAHYPRYRLVRRYH